MSAQFGRKAALYLTNVGGRGVDLSALRFSFEIRAADTQSPNTAVIRVYNLSDYTVQKTIAEFSRVIVQAGYENGNFGQIFSGSVKQFRRGKQSNVDSFLEILAADGDEIYNFGLVNTTIASGSAPSDRLSAITKALGAPKDPNADAVVDATGGILPRGKVLFGLGRALLEEVARSSNARWSIQSGVITMVPVTGYLPGTAVAINSATGMVSIPEATDNGIVVQTLLNPFLKIGGLIQINEKDITATTIKDRFFPNYTSIQYVANVTNDGFYRVMVVEHSGDTRGQEASWISEITCLAVDPSSPALTAAVSAS